MEKLVEDIWKSLWFSLATVTVILGFMRYLSNDRWWEVNAVPNSILGESEKSVNPLVYYTIKNSNNNKFINAELFIKNTPQAEYFGQNGVFENILPGQVASVRLNTKEGSVRSPAFRLQDREIRLLTFQYENGKLTYSGSHSRLRKTPASNLAVLDQSKEESLFQIDILREIESYKPLEEVAAKEEVKKVAEPAAEKEVEKKNLFFNKNKFQFNLELYSQFSPEHKSTCE